MEENNVDFFSNEYNDEYWRIFFESFKKSELLTNIEEDVPEDILNSLIGLLGYEQAKKWVHVKLRQLDSKTAIELVKSEKGIKALKAFMMRMPN